MKKSFKKSRIANIINFKKLVMAGKMSATRATELSLSVLESFNFALSKKVCKICKGKGWSNTDDRYWSKGIIYCKCWDAGSKSAVSVWQPYKTANGCPDNCPNKLNHIVEGQKSIKNKRLPKPN